MPDRVNNVYVYVADGLRWDSLPDEARQRGVCFKTVAQSLYSPPSFTTLATGLYPQQHGVHNFSNKLPDEVKTVFDLKSTNTGYYNEAGKDLLYKIFREDKLTDPSEIEPPFFFLERDITTHFPYEEGNNEPSYFRSNTWSEVKRDYREATKLSVEKLDSRLDDLEDRGVLDETLVVFTSDHGELFGEYGDALHVAPACPELVYVPTVFIHPSLSRGDFHVDDEVIEHVDVVETVLSSLNESDFQTMGADLLSGARVRDWGYNHAKVTRKGMRFYQADSIWWYDGGHAFASNTKTGRMAYLAYLLLRSKARHGLRRKPLTLAKQYLADSHLYGEPPVNESRARELIDEFVSGLDVTEEETVELDDEARERLEELGYLT